MTTNVTSYNFTEEKKKQNYDKVLIKILIIINIITVLTLVVGGVIVRMNLNKEKEKILFIEKSTGWNIDKVKNLMYNIEKNKVDKNLAMAIIRGTSRLDPTSRFGECAGYIPLSTNLFGSLVTNIDSNVYHFSKIVNGLTPEEAIVSYCSLNNISVSNRILNIYKRIK